ncbi:MAG: uncharacterized protein K0R38_6763 [Polyangiaceae bacterium]|jgi:hypothetical protein|nr:uncharacterized protein [Polyangiaceae bacterium]
MQSPRISSWGALVWVLLALLLSPRAAQALEAPTRVSVLTMGPGDHPFTRFGHNAILLEWADGRDAVYNYGTFEFNGLEGARDFMGGRFRYWLSVGTLDATRRAYGAARRSLVAQELALTTDERAQLFEALAENARPDNRYYAYDYYRDNCSTRVRDALDAVLGGALERQVTGTGRFTYRQHTLRLVGQASLLYFGLDSALGRPTDRPISRWQELFLPRELQEELSHAKRPGSGQPLVSAERLLLAAPRPPSPSFPPERTLPYLALGSTLGLALAGLGIAAPRYPAARAVLGAVTALLGFVLGLLGCALLVFAFSKHWAAHDNPSVLASPPWALGLVWYGVRLARGQRSWPALGALLAASLLTSTALFGFAVSPPHEPLRQAALFLPLWAGWLYGAWRAGSKARIESSN